MIPQICWGDNQVLDLIDLTPPHALSAGYRACLDLQHQIEIGALIRSKAGTRNWINGGPNQRSIRERQATVDLAMGLLHGRKLEEARDAYHESYLKWVRQDPIARASLLIVRACFSENPERKVLCYTLHMIWV